MHTTEIKQTFELAKNLIKEAGAILFKEKKKGFRVIRKDKKEMVTNLDLLIQNFLKNGLEKEFGDVLIFSEEQKQQLADQDCYWSIDPIDGTHNFIAGLKSYGISMAYIENNEVLLGLVYLPETDELYSAILGEGAFHNGTRIHCSTVDSLDKSIIAYDNQFYLDSKSKTRFMNLVDSSFTVRVQGCSVADASSVAHGHLSARIYNSTKLCDVAAGILLVKESGGFATDLSGNPIILNKISGLVLCNHLIQGELIEILNRH